MPNEQNVSGAQVPCISLLAALDDALNVRPHLVFEIGYTRVTDWMVHVWDSTGVGIGAAPKIVTAQAPDRDEAMAIAAAKLRELFPANKVVRGEEPSEGPRTYPPPCSVVAVKPPLGIMPERIWKEHRAWELMKCIVRHESQAGIPGEWWDELRRLLAELGTPNAGGQRPPASGGTSEPTCSQSESKGEEHD